MSMHGRLEDKKEYKQINESQEIDDDDDLASAYSNITAAKNQSVGLISFVSFSWDLKKH